MSKFTKDDLKRFQAESLNEKFQRTMAKVSEWYSRWDNEVYVSFSGGKDSTVLADICARWCKVINKPLYLMYVNTGLEYPEIQKFVKTYAQYLRDKYNIEVVLDIVRPKMRFDEVIKKYGYPIISKLVSEAIENTRKNIAKGKTDTVRYKQLHGEYMTTDGTRKSLFDKSKYEPLLYSNIPISDKCCTVMKKSPARQYERTTGRKPILAQLACESQKRTNAWLNSGCNGFDLAYPQSNPMAFWLENDVLWYIKEEQIPIASVYGEIVYADQPDQLRIEDFGLGGYGAEELTTTGCDRTGCIFCAFGCHLEDVPRFQRLKETHPRQYEYCIGGGEYGEDGMWKPNKQGLGMGHIFDELNKIYGEDFIKYK